MEIIESGAMRGKVGSDFWQRICRHLVKSDYFHKAPFSVVRKECGLSRSSE
jgi:hypothetical protein